MAPQPVRPDPVRPSPPQPSRGSLTSYQPQPPTSRPYGNVACRPPRTGSSAGEPSMINGHIRTVNPTSRVLRGEFFRSSPAAPSAPFLETKMWQSGWARPPRRVLEPSERRHRDLLEPEPLGVAVRPGVALLDWYSSPERPGTVPYRAAFPGPPEFGRTPLPSFRWGVAALPGRPPSSPDECPSASASGTEPTSRARAAPTCDGEDARLARCRRWRRAWTRNPPFLDPAAGGVARHQVTSAG
jgi:hypothetical protein